MDPGRDKEKRTIKWNITRVCIYTGTVHMNRLFLIPSYAPFKPSGNIAR